jgi:hypothetical protein
MMIVPHGKQHLWTWTAYYRDSFTFSYVDDGRTSWETHLWTSTACYRDGFTFLYVDDVRTSRETPMDLDGLLSK